ncbi:MAG: GntR family transcriptional regulator [Chloroflexi bacterium]|nr:GntR family transcriptional regulator [Chloroflexota bacterium]
MGETLAENISQAIRDDIIEGRLGIHSFLTERELANRFSVSKAPVRDALHRLCQEEYLVSFARKGYMVNMISAEEYVQIQQVRLHLEELSIKLAVKNATDVELDSLSEIISQQVAEKNPYKVSNTRFHLRLAEISRNRYLYSHLYSMLGTVARAVIVQIGPKDSLHMDHHARIIEALKRRDEQAAITALHEDIEQMELMMGSNQSRG